MTELEREVQLSLPLSEEVISGAIPIFCSRPPEDPRFPGIYRIGSLPDVGREDCLSPAEAESLGLYYLARAIIASRIKPPKL